MTEKTTDTEYLRDLAQQVGYPITLSGADADRLDRIAAALSAAPAEPVGQPVASGFDMGIDQDEARASARRVQEAVRPTIEASERARRAAQADASSYVVGSATPAEDGETGSESYDALHAAREAARVAAPPAVREALSMTEAEYLRARYAEPAPAAADEDHDALRAIRANDDSDMEPAEERETGTCSRFDPYTRASTSLCMSCGYSKARHAEPAPVPAAAPAEGPGEVLQELYARMAEKVPVLREMARKAGAPTTTRVMTDRSRLDGKADGVATAAGYVDEAIRALAARPAPAVPGDEDAAETQGGE